MLTPQQIDTAAHASLEMHRKRERYRPLDPGLRGGPLDDAYRIQDALHGLMRKAGRGDIVGWKIAHALPTRALRNALITTLCVLAVYLVFQG